MQATENGLRGLGEAMFENVDLGDRRRTKRLVTVFAQIRRHPGGTLPDKLKSPADLKALYRLCASPAVTHRRILDAVRRHTQAQFDGHPGPILILHDGTELDYSGIVSLAKELGQIGSGWGRGYICHNSLAVDAGSREILGLTNQLLHCRDDIPENETLPQSRARESRESLLWLRGTEGLPGDWRLVDICDQAADTFEFLEHESRSGRRFVIRSKAQRCVYLGHEPRGKRQPLSQHVDGLTRLGNRTLEVQSQKGDACRRAAGKRRGLGRVRAGSQRLALWTRPRRPHDLGFLLCLGPPRRPPKPQTRQTTRLARPLARLDNAPSHARRRRRHPKEKMWVNLSACPTLLWPSWWGGR